MAKVTLICSVLAESVSCSENLVAGFSLRSFGFHPREAYMKYMVDKVALRQILFRIFRRFTVSIIPSYCILVFLSYRTTDGVDKQSTNTHSSYEMSVSLAISIPTLTKIPVLKNICYCHCPFAN